MSLNPQSMKTLFSCVLALVVVPVCLCAADRWQPLWDGATLAGWQIVSQGQWSIEAGAIRGRQVAGESEYGHLVTTQIYTDFAARLKFKAVRGNSGFCFRIEPTGLLALQVHGGQDCDVRFKDLEILLP